MGSYSILSNTDTTITLYITGVSVGDAIRVFARYYNDTSSKVHDNSHTATASSYQYTITGLTPGTQYMLNVGSKSSVSSDTTTWWEGKEADTTYMSLWISGYGQMWVTVLANAWVTDAGSYYIKYTIAETGAFKTSATASLAAGGSPTDSYTVATFTGLSPGTTYTINGVLYNADTGEVAYRNSITFTTEEKSRPENWAWISTVQAGAAMPIVQVGDMVYEVMPLTADEWNGFTARINEFRVYAGVSEYSFTTVYPREGNMAAQLNHARTAISEIPNHGTLPDETSSDSAPKASFINGLKDALNSVP